MNLLVADIGGTNARFGFQKKLSSNLEFINYLNCEDYKTIDDAITYYIQKNELNVENIVLSVAGPCSDNIVKFSNNKWKFDKLKLLRKLNVDSLLAINDFVAQGFGFSNFYKEQNLNTSIKNIEKYQLKLIKKGIPIKDSNLLITGPGTGLGVCTLTKLNNYVYPIEGEGGNVNFSPQDELEIELLKFLLKEKNYVSFEDVISGRGLQNIYKFINYKNKKSFKNVSPSVIGELALSNEPIAKKTVTIMFSILGTAISSYVLINGCQRGVIITGGIFKKLSKLLDQSNFFFNLINKGNYKNYVDNVPIYLSMDECNGLKGSAICFKNKYFTKSRTVYNI